MPISHALSTQAAPQSGGSARAGRSHLEITLAVWHALLLRESLSRLFARRAAWVWLLLEPAAHVLFMVLIFAVIRVSHIGGINTALWLIVGMLAFFFFRRTFSQGANAIKANAALFTYRQVKPIDTVLMRCVLEALLMLAITLLLLGGAALLGVSVVPSDPLAVMEALFGMWLLGLGFGLITSVITSLISELDNIMSLMMMPLYMISGTMIPMTAIPSPYREWLMFNPAAHGVEAIRLGFAPFYHAVPELSLAYLYGFALVTVFFGLALHARFAQRLVTQ
jgi:capsular polysaccharide transport system permease protein